MLTASQIKAAGPYSFFPMPDRAAFWAAVKNSSAHTTASLTEGMLFRTRKKLKSAWLYFVVTGTGYAKAHEHEFIAFITKAKPPAPVTAADPVPEPVQAESVPEPKAAEPKASKSKKASKPKTVSAKPAAAKPVVLTGLQYHVGSGSDLGKILREGAATLIRGTGPKLNSDLESRIADAKLLVVVEKNETVVGCVGLQQRAETYISKLRTKSGATLKDDALEFCWLRVNAGAVQDKDSLEQVMFDKLMDAVKADTGLSKRKVFAVYNTDDTIGYALMSKFKFNKHDRDHEGAVRRAQLFTL